MADAEDLKSSGDFSSCGFDSHPGHHLQSQVVPVAPGFQLRAQTPAKRLKFDSHPGHHSFPRSQNCTRPATPFQTAPDLREIRQNRLFLSAEFNN